MSEIRRDGGSPTGHELRDGSLDREWYAEVVAGAVRASGRGERRLSRDRVVLDL